MHLTERRRRGRRALEFLELSLPLGAELRRHAPVDERPAHGRRLGLQHGELGHVLGRQGARHSRQQLRDLDDRPAQLPQRLAELARQRRLVAADPEIVAGRQAGREPAEHGGDPHITGEPSGQAAEGGRIGHGAPI